MWLCDICVYIVKYMFHGKFAFSIQNYILYPAENLGIIFGCSQNMSLCKIPQFHYLPFVKILWKATVSAEFWAIRGKTLRKLCLSENFHTGKFCEISVFYAVYSIRPKSVLPTDAKTRITFV